MTAARPLDEALDAIHAAMDRGDLTAAERTLRSVLTRHPRDRELLLLRASIAYERGDGDAALQSVDSALLAYPDDVSLALQKAAILLDLLDDPVGALDLTSEAIEGLNDPTLSSEDPDPHGRSVLLSEAWTTRAQCELELDMREDALESANAAVELDDHNGVAQVLVGACNFELGDLVEAEACARTALALDNSLADAHWLLARITAARGDPAAAVPHTRKAATNNPGRYHVPPVVTRAAFERVLQKALDRMDPASRDLIKRSTITLVDTAPRKPGISPGALTIRQTEPPHTEERVDFTQAPPMSLLLVWPNVVLSSSSLPDLEAVLASTLLGDVAAHMSLGEVSEGPEPELDG